jgi:hypothetical protein
MRSGQLLGSQSVGKWRNSSSTCRLARVFGFAVCFPDLGGLSTSEADALLRCNLVNLLGDLAAVEIQPRICPESSISDLPKRDERNGNDYFQSH